MWLRLKTSLYILIHGGTEIMVVVYVALIIAGRKTYAQVPSILKDKVKAELIALELGDLAIEKAGGPANPDNVGGK